MTNSCPYLDTINRTLLDFDFEPSCSTTLESSPHIYACLVCGKYFRGKGKQTPAYIHSVDEGHFVYVHLTKGTFHCLPEDYEISQSEPSLRDISLALHPAYTAERVRRLDDDQELARDLFGRRYLPGFVGLNNLNKTDYLNAVVQALGHVRPLRDFFLLAGDDDRFSHLARCFSALLRNMWSPHRFKSNVDPHMLVQAVSVASNKRYHVGKQAEAGDFMAWLLHQLHLGVGGSTIKKQTKAKKNKYASTIIQDTFMGTVEVTTVVKKRKRRGESKALEILNEGGKHHVAGNHDVVTERLQEHEDDDDRAGSDDEETLERKRRKRETIQSLADETIFVEETTVTETEFLQLTLDIPEKPLFKDQDGGLVIPQEPLVNVLRKFDGVSFSDVLAMQHHPRSSETHGDDGGIIVSMKRRYRLKKLPNYLILHLSRFKRNNFSVEKNPTIVMFPVKNFDLSSYVFPNEGERDKIPTEEEMRVMSVSMTFVFAIGRLVRFRIICFFRS